ncbi:hypothetical protein Agabi119p4_11370 [Agaricus bisporus var. burnettii]|uniref:Protein kinase domain-containing protein n=1 Tax=Agaricus bisporus var. burnettii TaxID=192524 RepID=A0A8H7C001_AGABI|nr:hypothetical protein Agabi119p4_11370 [Agaricus bisporus var. burnettii]
MPVPDEQKENWEQTRNTVIRAAISVLGPAAVAAHKTLAASISSLEVVPVPGLVVAAKLLLYIWDAVQEVDTNRLAFLRLAERCACIVITLHQEMKDAGESIVQELSGALSRIEELFTSVQCLIDKEGHVPFLKRFLKRDETYNHIRSLNRQLDQELQILGPSIQIRTVKVIKEFTAGMDDRIESAIQRALQNSSYFQASPHTPGLTHTPRTPSILRPSPRRFSKPLEEIISVQDDKDRELDLNDLDQQMDHTLQLGNDMTMFKFLQVPREDILEAIKTMQRYLEKQRQQGARDSANVRTHDSRNILGCEFIEAGIDTLRRMSKSSSSLPSWTITRFEIDCGKVIGVGAFSDVYEGWWRGQTVAVKVLRDFNSSRLFVREVEIWKNLSHPNVIELYGASSASGSPPWFFVSPFAKHGDLTNHLRYLSMGRERGLGLLPSFSSTSTHTLEKLRRDSFRPSRESDLNRFMLEIAMGMDYLHEHGVLHGDLKSANVLVDENYICLISDFGQSEIKAEHCRMTGVCDSRGTLRWQPPEVMEGLSDLTPKVDVYAFAITCVEILNMGQMPWSLMDDSSVQFVVLKENGRPSIPEQYHATALYELLQHCWHRDSDIRPSFSEVVLSLRKHRHSLAGIQETPPPCFLPRLPESESYPGITSPTTLSPCASSHPLDHQPQLKSRASFYNSSPGTRGFDDVPSPESTAVESPPESDREDPKIPSNDSCSTILSEDSALSEEFVKVDTGVNQMSWEARNERRYRMHLTHHYHSTLNLALWQPVPVTIGAVGYMVRPTGSFVTLFNAITPCDSPDPRVANMPSIRGYGSISIGSHRHVTRNVAKRGLDAVVEFLSSGKREETIPHTSRRVSVQLRAGQKTAFIYTEATEYYWLQNLQAAKMWFKANVDRILDTYGVEHQLHREDLCLVVAVLQAPNYALFVGRKHPNGNVHFHTFPHKRSGKPWGVFTTDNKVSDEQEGPRYCDSTQQPLQCACKVSVHGDQPNALLLTRLRFPPDSDEPTSA